MKLRSKIENIKALYRTGRISYDDAKILATPIINELNNKIKTKASDLKKRPFKLTFAGLFR